jgi:hypothetical protein
MPILGTIASSTQQGLSTTSYVSIATQTVGSGGSSSIQFNSIPATYQNLQLRFVAKSTVSGSGSGGETVRMTMNSTSFTKSAYLYVTGTSLASANTSNPDFIANLDRAGDTSFFTAGVVDIFDYRNTNKTKTLRTIGGMNINGSSEFSLNVNVWNSTSTITSLTITPSSGNFAQYSSFALYGIKGL